MSSKTDTSRRKPTHKPQCPAIARIRQQRLATYVAGELGLKRAAISMWKRVPAKHVLKVGALLHIAKHRIRPDIYTR